MSIRANLANPKGFLKWQKVALLAVLVCISFAATSPHSLNGKVKTITIDAGHGGHDVGCMYGGAREKDVTLTIALKVGEHLQKLMPDVKVVYTRKTDEFIELHERAAIANKSNSDLFISIHCNANKKTAVFGSETYTMGLYKSEGNLDVAKRENDVILMEKDYQEQYEGFDPNSPEAHIYFSFLQSAYLEQSLRLASLVEQKFVEKRKLSRGVKQAGFLVLWRSKMPSILIETGFLSNKADRAMLTSASGQNELAAAIASGIADYRKGAEGK
jgi:N-acetylmuramoyl-L-alanine amidase